MFKKIVGGVVVAMVLAGGALAWVNWYFGLPVAYHYPNGACATVVERTEEGVRTQPCGWEKGRKYHVEYVGYETNLVELAQK